MAIDVDEDRRLLLGIADTHRHGLRPGFGEQVSVEVHLVDLAAGLVGDRNQVHPTFDCFDVGLVEDKVLGQPLEPLDVRCTKRVSCSCSFAAGRSGHGSATGLADRDRVVRCLRSL